jgi:hypothetical protein
MSTISLSEIVYGAAAKKTKAEKVEWLRRHNCLELRNILKIMYDRNLKLLIPDTAPPYKPSDLPDSHGMLYRETRKLKHFVEGYSGNLTQLKREQLFIQMLETVDKDDAKLLIDMIAQKPIEGLTAATINKAFNTELVPTGKDKA